MTVAREQWVIVGVRRMVRVVRDVGDVGDFLGGWVARVAGVARVVVVVLLLLLEDDDDERCMSGRLTTAREPRDRGCSGSEIGAMRSGSW